MGAPSQSDCFCLSGQEPEGTKILANPVGLRPFDTPPGPWWRGRRNHRFVSGARVDRTGVGQTGHGGPQSAPTLPERARQCFKRFSEET